MVLDFSANDRRTNSNFTRDISQRYCQLPVDLQRTNCGPGPVVGHVFFMRFITASEEYKSGLGQRHMWIEIHDILSFDTCAFINISAVYNNHSNSNLIFSLAEH